MLQKIGQQTRTKSKNYAVFYVWLIYFTEQILFYLKLALYLLNIFDKAFMLTNNGIKIVVH